MLYGYRIDDDICFPAVPKQRTSTKMYTRKSPADLVRSPVAADLGVTVKGQVMPFPDTLHGPTVAAGLKKRVMAKLPDQDLAILREFKGFVTQWCRDHLEPLDPMTDFSVEAWLAKTNYPTWRKEELSKVKRYLPGDLPDEYYDFKSFIKPEFYEEIKHPRTIQSPSDELLVALGPYVTCAEDVMFKNDKFIKKVPVAQRPKYIVERFPDSVSVAATDFSNFELSQQRAQFEACELPILAFLFHRLPEFDAIMQMLMRMEIGQCRLVFKYVTAVIHATRKSGARTTSFGNGSLNMLSQEFAGFKLGLGRMTGIFEGDDGLFCYESGKFPSPDFYVKLGLSIKLEVFDSVSKASFCGMVFDPQECIAVKNPVTTLMKLGWGHASYFRCKETKRLALLRCKAMSLAAECPRAPVLAAAADWILRCTRSIDHRWVLKSRNTSWWQREQYAHLTSTVDRRECGLPTRQLVADKFGVSIEEQHTLEKWFDSQETLCQIVPTWYNELWARQDELFTRVLGNPSLDRRPVFPDSTDVYVPCEYLCGNDDESILPKRDQGKSRAFL